MARVTLAEVKQILDTKLDDITIFIETANLLVTEELRNKDVSVARQKLIELYLAAHFTTLRERQLKSQSFGDATDVYMGEVAMHLASSLYGQTALALDPTGTLANKGKSKALIEMIS